MKCQRKETLQTDSKTKENNIEQTIHWSKYNKKIRLQNHQSSTDRNSISIQEIDWWSKSLDKSFWTQKDLRLTYQDARGKVIEPINFCNSKWSVSVKYNVTWNVSMLFMWCDALKLSNDRSGQHSEIWYNFLLFRHEQFFVAKIVFVETDYSCSLTWSFRI